MTFTTKKWLAAAATVLVSWSVLSCRLFQKKPQDQAGTASIDAILKNNGADRRVFPCGKDAKIDDSVDVALTHAWEAAPKFLTTGKNDNGEQVLPSGMYFPKESIKLYPSMEEVQKVCGEAAKKTDSLQSSASDAMKGKLDMLLSCAITGIIEGQTEVRPIIHIYAKTDIIYGNLIRTMAWTFSALVDLALKNPETQKKDPNDATVRFFKRFVAKRESLARGVIADLHNMGNHEVCKAHGQSAAECESFPKCKFEAESTSCMSLGESTINSYNKVYKVDDKDLATSVFLQHFLLSETTDSFYCSQDSNKEFFTYNFANTVCSYAEFGGLFGRPYFFDAKQEIKYCQDGTQATPTPSTTPAAAGSPTAVPTTSAFKTY